MKRFVVGLLSGIFILVACAPAATESTVLSSPTGTPTIVPATFTPSATQIQPTRTTPALAPGASVTSLPTIPTFTPTFDVQTIVTVTSAAKAECPKEPPPLKPDFQLDYYAHEADQKIPEFLNKGGLAELMANEISKVHGEYSYQFTDVTNDGIPELIFDGFEKIYDTFYILWCQDGQYNVFAGEKDMGVSMGNRIYQIVDMNKNGVPEIVIYKVSGTGGGEYHFFIGEWNGTTFINLAPNLYLGAVDDSKIEIRDLNGDGTLELRLIGGSYDYEVPWRQSIHTYMWDGKYFVEQPVEYVQPVYRFQAIQDADTAVVVEKYDRAIQLYQEVVSNQRLEWWSVERQKYVQAIIDAPWNNEPTPSVKPIEDKTEYPRLAAYAYYRIILLHIVQRSESDASTVYKTLQQKFGNDPYGRPYVEMATAFWDTYQSSHKMYDSCAAAIDYAAKHPEILIPLGSDYHGSQSHTYVPADVCPFR